MFSQLGSIFTQKPRHAETLDTRQDIRHHDPDYDASKKKKKNADERFVIDEDDRTIVSVEALQVFLEHFLATQAQTTDEQKSPSPQDVASTETPKPTQNTNGMASVAANAYQHTAQARQKPQNTLNDDASESYLGNADIRTIHGLLSDLKILSERGIEYLNIERSSSFLNSLVTAVEKLK